MKLKLRSVQFKFRCSSCGKFVWLDWKVKRSGKLRIGHYNQHSEAPGSKRQWAWLWNTLSICDVLRMVLPADLVSLESLLVCQCVLPPHTPSLLVSSMQLREHSWVLTVHLQLLAFFLDSILCFPSDSFLPMFWRPAHFRTHTMHLWLSWHYTLAFPCFFPRSLCFRTVFYTPPNSEWLGRRDVACCDHCFAGWNLGAFKIPSVVSLLFSSLTRVFVVYTFFPR